MRSHYGECHRSESACILNTESSTELGGHYVLNHEGNSEIAEAMEELSHERNSEIMQVWLLWHDARVPRFLPLS